MPVWCLLLAMLAPQACEEWSQTSFLSFRPAVSLKSSTPDEQANNRQPVDSLPQVQEQTHPVATSELESPDDDLTINEKLNEKNSDQELTPEAIKYRKNLIAVGWILLLGIGLLGGILVAMILIMGGLARKTALKPTPQAKLKNPFWYLKPDNQNPRE